MPMAMVVTTTPTPEARLTAKSEFDTFNIATKTSGMMHMALYCSLLEASLVSISSAMAILSRIMSRVRRTTFLKSPPSR